MTHLLALYLGFLSALVGLYVLVRYLSGKDELVSLRNFFLAGFVLFQLFSGIEPLWTEHTSRWVLNDWASTGLLYSVMATVFLVLFFIFYIFFLNLTNSI